jgi:sugar phosphate permease
LPPAKDHPPDLQTSHQKVPPPRLAWFIWGIATVFFLIAFFQRVSLAVMTSELMAAFAVGASGLGTLSAFYYYFYMTLQIPSGILVDSWGPRRLLTLGSLTAALGAIIFSLAPNFFWACMGRALIGGSVAVAFLSSLKLAAHWLPPRQYALASGFALLFGVVGGVAAGVPLRLLIDRFGWRPSIFAVGILTLISAGTTWAIVRDTPAAKGFRSYGLAPPNPPPPKHPARRLTGLFRVLGFRNTWLLAFSAGGLIGPVLAFCGLWGVPFLQARFDLKPTSGAAICSLTLVSWAIAGPLLGGLSDRIGRRKPLYIAACGAAIVLWAAIIFLPFLPLSIFVVLILLAGFASGGNIIGFAFSKESVPLQLSGTVSGFVNLGNMVGPTFLTPAIGWVLDWRWAGQMAGGVRVYDLQAFHSGFLLILGCSLLAFLLISLTEETYCRQMADQ